MNKEVVDVNESAIKGLIISSLKELNASDSSCSVVLKLFEESLKSLDDKEAENVYFEFLKEE